MKKSSDFLMAGWFFIFLVGCYCCSSGELYFRTCIVVVVLSERRTNTNKPRISPPFTVAALPDANYAYNEGAQCFVVSIGFMFVCFCDGGWRGLPPAIRSKL